MDGAVSQLMLELLSWIEARPRTYAETLDAWRSSCPRHPVWEDAWMNGLVDTVESDDGMGQSIVVLTAAGKHMLSRNSLFSGQPNEIREN